MSMSDWVSSVAAVGTAIAAIVAAVGVLFAYWQLCTSKKIAQDQFEDGPHSRRPPVDWRPQGASAEDQTFLSYPLSKVSLNFLREAPQPIIYTAFRHRKQPGGTTSR